MRKKLVSLLLVAAMTATMVMGCGNSESTDSADNSAGAGTENADASSEDDGEMAEINVAWMTLSTVDQSQTDAVEEAINAITESEINTHVDIEFFDATAYGTQVPMKIQANEKLDLMMYIPLTGAGYSSFNAQNQLMDISSYLNEYGQDVLNALGTLIEGTSDGDAIYGAAANRLFATDLYAVMRKDVLDELGLTEKAENMTTWTEYEEILKEVVANTDLAGIGNVDNMGSTIAVSPFFTGDDEFSKNYGFDNLGDTFNLIYGDEATDTAQCYYMSDQYEQAAKRANDWYNEGLIYKDAATSQDSTDVLIKNNVCFSIVCGSEMGVETTKQSSTGYELVCKKIAAGNVGTSNTYKFGFAVPVCATEPEAAVKFMNLLYSNEEIENTLAWGVEGRDWVEQDGVATFPEGVTSETVTYHMADFLNGNQFITLPWDGNGADFREQQQAANDEATTSKYVGFSFDPTGVEDTLTACYNVSQQYAATINSGSAPDFDSYYAEFKEKLTAAGINDVLAAYQEQLDAWLAEQ